MMVGCKSLFGTLARQFFEIQVDFHLQEGVAGVDFKNLTDRLFPDVLWCLSFQCEGFEGDISFWLTN